MEPLESLFFECVLLAIASEVYCIDLREFGSKRDSLQHMSDCCLSLERVAANKQLENLMSGDIFTLYISQDSAEFTLHFIFWNYSGMFRRYVFQ